MNHLPNLKIDTLIQKIINTEFAITKNAGEPDDDKIRIFIDERRHLLALLKTETDTWDLTGNCPTVEYNYTPNPDIEDFINTWCDRITSTSNDKATFENLAFCHLLLDHTLPKFWNFEDDLVVIHQPQSISILEAARSRKQKHIIVFDPADRATRDVRAYLSSHKINYSKTIEDLERTVSLLQTRAQQVISISCDTELPNKHEINALISNAINAGKRTRIENTATTSKFGKAWAVNILKNLPKLQNSKNLHQIRISGVDDAIVVASGPSLSKNVEKLRDVQEKVFIVAALRSLPVLNAAGVEPDLVIQLDAEDDHVAQKLSPPSLHPIKNLLLEGLVNPGFFDLPAKNIIWSLPQHFFDVHQRFGTKPTPFNVPSVSIYGLSLCQFLNFKNICFIGQDLAASSGKQYADGATELLPAHADISMFKIEVPGFFGDKVMTRNSYEYQIKRCSEIAREWQLQQIDMNLVNATEGGAFIPEFNHMTLEGYIAQRQLQAKKTIKSFEFLPEFPITSDGAASYSRDIHEIMDKILALANVIIKLEGKTEKNRGLEKKIRKIVQKFQELNSRTSLLQMAMQEEIAQVIGTSRKVETVDSYGQFFTKIKDNAMTLKAAAKL